MQKENFHEGLYTIPGYVTLGMKWRFQQSCKQIMTVASISEKLRGYYYVTVTSSCRAICQMREKTRMGNAIGNV